VEPGLSSRPPENRQAGDHLFFFSQLA